MGSHHRQTRTAGGEVFPVGDVFEVRDQGLRRHWMEIEPLRPAADRVEQLVGLGRGEDEDDVFGWLFECLEQCVPGGAGQHVRLVEDVDPASAGGRGDGTDVDPDLANVLDLVVRRCVQLDHIQRSALRDAHARDALVARLAVCPEVRAVQRLGEQARRCGLARSPRSREQVGVRDLRVDDLSRERVDDVVLADDLGESLRPVLAVESLVLHRRAG